VFLIQVELGLFYADIRDDDLRFMITADKVRAIIRGSRKTDGNSGIVSLSSS